MAQLVASASGVVLGGVAKVVVHKMRYDFVIHRISNNNLCAYNFNTSFLGPAKHSRQSSIYSLTSMDYSWGWQGWGFISNTTLNPCTVLLKLFSLFC